MVEFLWSGILLSIGIMSLVIGYHTHVDWVDMTRSSDVGMRKYIRQIEKFVMVNIMMTCMAGFVVLVLGFIMLGKALHLYDDGGWFLPN